MNYKQSVTLVLMGWSEVDLKIETHMCDNVMFHVFFNSLNNWGQI